jgi:phage shock protein PspC (stress-responsive transcriptional regulator)
MNYKKFTRSLTDRKIAGVCGGLGAYFNIDPTIVRILFICLLIFGGSGVLLYLIFWIVSPEA